MLDDDSPDPVAVQAPGSYPMPVQVRILLRRPLSWHFGAERMADTIVTNQPAGFKVRVRKSRFFSSGVLGRLADIFLVAFDRRGVHHVLGDVHFLCYLLPRKRVVLTILDMISIERASGWRRRLLFFLWYWLPVRRSNIITVISESTRQQVIRHLRLDRERVRVVHCAVSNEFNHHPKPFGAPRPVALHVGLTQNKNLERHVEALIGLDVELRIVGRLSGAQRAFLENSAIDYKNVHSLSKEDLRKEYVNADFLLFCSTYEGFGLPIIEAQATGRPVITSNCWSMPEIAGSGALLVDPHDVSEIRGAVIKLLDDEALRAQLVEHGLKNVNRFSESEIAQKYFAIYRELAGELANEERLS